jgi:ankyrin repeat protein
MNDIFYAAKNGNLNRVKQFLNQGVNVNAQTGTGRRRALHYAAEGGHLPVVKFLLNKGSAINSPDRHGNRPIHNAAAKGHLPVVKELLNRGSNIHARTIIGYQPLHFAINHGHLPVVKELLNRGANVHARTKLGYHPIHMAASEGYLNIVKELINRGANIRARGYHDLQPINLAARKSKLLPVVKELIRLGVNPSNIRKTNMSTAVANYLRLLSVKPAVEKFKQLRAKARAKAHTRNRAPSIVLAEHPLSPFNPNTIKRRAKKYEMSFGQYVKDLGFTNVLY